jgi:hypothetical protein
MDLTFTSVITDGTPVGTVSTASSSAGQGTQVTVQTAIGTNANLWDIPATNATSFDASSTFSLNPNAVNFDLAASKPKSTTVDPNSITATGGFNRPSSPPNRQKKYDDVSNQHTVTPEEIRNLEKQTNLTLYPYMFGGELARIKNQFSNLNINKYYLLLNFLVYGFDNKILSSSMQDGEKYVVDQGFINDFIRMSKTPQLQEALRKTPAYQKGSFDEIGKLGSTEVNVENMESSPLGARRYSPSLVVNLMEKIAPGSVESLEKFCNAIRTRSYLSLPKGALGSIARVVAGINGVISAFQAIINDIYNGLILYVQQIYAWINGIIAQVQKELMKAIEEIIPLDLICLLLDTFQVILDDINFFSSLFNMSDSFVNTMNSIQNVVNIASQIASNPFTTASIYFSQFIPSDVQNIIQQINQIGTDPGGFIADQLSNYGYAWAAQAMQGNIIGALVNKYGPQYAAFNPIANILTQSSAILNRYGQGAQMYPSTAATLGPNVYNGGREDVYGHPIDSGNIFSNIARNFNAGVESARSIFQPTPQTP